MRNTKDIRLDFFKTAFFSMILASLWHSTLQATLQPGFKDLEGVYPPAVRNYADATIKNVSQKYGVPIAMRTGPTSFDVDRIGIQVNILLDNIIKVEVAVGEELVQKGLFSMEEGRRLGNVMEAYMREALSDSAIFVGTHFIENTIASKIHGEAYSVPWERLTLILLVAAFAFLAGITYFIDEWSTQTRLPDPIDPSGRHLF